MITAVPTVRQRVLLIDDDELIACRLRSFLLQNGFDVDAMNDLVVKISRSSSIKG